MTWKKERNFCIVIPLIQFLLLSLPKIPISNCSFKNCMKPKPIVFLGKRREECFALTIELFLTKCSHKDLTWNGL